MERETGIEPAASSLGSLRSTTELLPQPMYDVRFTIYEFELRKSHFTLLQI